MKASLKKNILYSLPLLFGTLRQMLCLEKRLQYYENEWCVLETNILELQKQWVETKSRYHAEVLTSKKSEVGHDLLELQNRIESVISKHHAVKNEYMEDRIRFINLKTRLDNAGLKDWFGIWSSRQVRKLPASRLMTCIRFFCSPKTLQKVYDPLYADFQKEYFDALAAGRKVQAGWIRLRFYGSVVKTMGLFNVAKLAKEAYEYWKVSSSS